MQGKFSLFFILVVLVAVSPAAFGQWVSTGTTNITVSVGPEAALSVNSATPLTTGTTLFDDYAGTTTFSYKVRTTRVGGSGSIAAQVLTDFSPGNGPSVQNPPTAGNTLSYGCTVAGPGSPCSGSIAAQYQVDTNVATFGANARSARAGDSGSLAWVLTNDPRYETGNYTAVVRFTISAM
ncbi:MAG: hypothetical protein C0504_02315 [Candidatus Solibacter sp.]|nr:hypothetical protein [Candidatus Solibacter sp.]